MHIASALAVMLELHDDRFLRKHKLAVNISKLAGCNNISNELARYLGDTFVVIKLLSWI